MRVLEADGDTLTLVTQQQSVFVKCINAPQVGQIKATPEGDTLVTGADITFSAPVDAQGREVGYEWTIDGETMAMTTPSLVYNFTEKKTYNISLLVYDRTDRTCSNRATYLLDLQDQIPPLPAPTWARDDDAEKYYGWIPYVLLLLSLGMTAWLWRRYRQQQEQQKERNKLAILQQGNRFQAPDKPPYQPPFKSRNDMVSREVRQFAIANIFRQREQGHRRFLDVPKTLQKTAEGGGYPNFQYRYRTRPADYLFLIDEHYPDGHQVQLFKYLVGMLRQQDVYIDDFYYQDIPHRVWNDDDDEGMTLDQLARLYPERRLIIFGHGHEWLDELEQRTLAPTWQVALQGWPARLMVTPMPLSSWTFREAPLYQLLALFPADMAHLLLAAQYIEGGMDEGTLPTTLRQWESYLQRNRYDVDVNRRWRNRSDYADYLRNHPGVFRWLQALIVHPEPQLEHHHRHR